MVTMTTPLLGDVSSWWGNIGPITRAELDALPDDGRRHELVDGVLVVSPAPVRLHQRAQLRMSRLLEDACPQDMEVIPAPFDVALAEDTVLQPDVVVAFADDYSEKDLPVAPQLAVEVVSPLTRRYDRTLKRSRFEEAGTPSFWVVDPDEPSVTAWELRGARYEEAGHAAGDELLEVTLPYPIRIVPAALVARRT